MNKFQMLPSENIIKLRQLTDEICNIHPVNESIIENLKNIIESGSNKILSSKTERTKLKYYEQMFSEIKKIINEN